MIKENRHIKEYIRDHYKERYIIDQELQYMRVRHLDKNHEGHRSSST